MPILALVLTISACQQANKPPVNEASPPQNDRTVRTKQTAPSPNNNATAEETAHRLAKLATKIPEVNDATVIVFGNYAIVGIDVDATLDRSKTGTIKYSVAEALKEDPNGASALVTSDPDINQRLREMRTDIRGGRPFAGIAEELADIAGRIIPLAPQDVQRIEEPANKQNQQNVNQDINAKPRRLP